jgi:hypothetical protein
MVGYLGAGQAILNLGVDYTFARVDHGEGSWYQFSLFGREDRRVSTAYPVWAAGVWAQEPLEVGIKRPDDTVCGWQLRTPAGEISPPYYYWSDSLPSDEFVIWWDNGGADTRYQDWRRWNIIPATSATLEITAVGGSAATPWSADIGFSAEIHTEHMSDDDLIVVPNVVDPDMSLVLEHVFNGVNATFPAVEIDLDVAGVILPLVNRPSIVMVTRINDAPSVGSNFISTDGVFYCHAPPSDFRWLFFDTTVIEPPQGPPDRPFRLGPENSRIGATGPARTVWS